MPCVGLRLYSGEGPCSNCYTAVPLTIQVQRSSQELGPLQPVDRPHYEARCRKHGIASQTLYRWKGKYGGMEVSEAKRLRALEEENRQLMHTVAELLLDKRALQAVLSKKW